MEMEHHDTTKITIYVQSVRSLFTSLLLTDASWLCLLHFPAEETDLWTVYLVHANIQGKYGVSDVCHAII